MKPKILFVVDSEEWALGTIAKQLKRNLSEYYDIDIISLDIFNDNIVKVLILARKYNLAHFFWRGHIYWLDYENSRNNIKNLHIDYEKFINDFVRNKVTTAVCDHLFINSHEENVTKYTLNICKNYIVTSKKLFDIYNEKEEIKKPFMIIHDAVDIEKFIPNNIERLKNIENRKINIGWVGNSKFTDSDNDDDLKGLRKIIIPALQELKEEGYNIEEKFADRTDRLIPYDEMPEYYNEIDLYLCASKTEGTPLPVLEAMACGIPIISTDVGIVSEVFGKKQTKFILEERTKESLKNKIKELLSKKELFYELSSENLEQIKEWSWIETSLKYKKFFDENLNN